MVRSWRFDVSVLACLALIAATGCTAQKKDDQVQGKMFYRGVARAPAQTNSMTVGRQGHDADYGRWEERGSANSGEWLDTSTSVGRQGGTAQSGSWNATGVGGDPIDNGGIGASYYDRGGSTQGIEGNGASSSEFDEGSARYGNE